MVRLILVLAACCAVTGCTRNSTQAEAAKPDTVPKDSSGPTPNQQTEWNRIEQMEAQAKAIARIDGCTTSSACRAAPVGSRACGGPRYYFPYCAATTDSAALFAKLDEVSKAEIAFNRKYQMVSTCEMRLPPAVELSGGSCVTQ